MTSSCGCTLPVTPGNDLQGTKIEGCPPLDSHQHAEDRHARGSMKVRANPPSQPSWLHKRARCRRRNVLILGGGETSSFLAHKHAHCRCKECSLLHKRAHCRCKEWSLLHKRARCRRKEYSLLHKRETDAKKGVCLSNFNRALNC